MITEFVWPSQLNSVILLTGSVIQAVGWNGVRQGRSYERPCRTRLQPLTPIGKGQEIKAGKKWNKQAHTDPMNEGQRQRSVGKVARKATKRRFLSGRPQVVESQRPRGRDALILL